MAVVIPTRFDKRLFLHARDPVLNGTGKFKILVVQNTDIRMFILPKINFGPAQETVLHVNELCLVVQNTSGPKIQNTDGAQATSVF